MTSLFCVFICLSVYLFTYMHIEIKSYFSAFLYKSASKGYFPTLQNKGKISIVSASITYMSV